MSNVPTAMGKTIKAVETNVSSNGVTKYATLLYTDGSMSCDCSGWVVQKKVCNYCAKQHCKKHSSYGSTLLPRACTHTKAWVKKILATGVTPEEFVATPVAAPKKRTIDFD